MFRVIGAENAKRLWILSGIFLFFILSQRVHAESFDCDSRIISIGESKWKVEKLCGPPIFIDQRREEKTIERYKKIKEKDDDRESQEDKAKRNDRGLHDDEVEDKYAALDQNSRLVSKRKFDINIEEWTYNLGPDRFIRTLVFHNDRLVSILTGGYGFDKSTRESARSAEIGDSKALILFKYGEPIHRDIRTQEETTVDYKEKGDFVFVEKYKVLVDIEEWIYDRDPNRLAKKLLFKNNRLVDID